MFHAILAEAALAFLSLGLTHAGHDAPCDHRRPEWIWCDDFEQDRMRSYFEVRLLQGRFRRESGVGRDGSSGMRAHWEAGQVDAGFLHLAFGRTPGRYFRPVDDGTRDYREIYWRLYVRTQPGWTGTPGKLSRAIVFADTTWAQAAIAHVWNSGPRPWLGIEPASGTDPRGRVVTMRYNDFPNLRWLGHRPGRTPIFAADRAGRWTCVEAHAKLNDPGARNGVFELWVDGNAEASRADLDFVATYRDYGFNALYVENWWNEGAPIAEDRFIDDLVVSTARIGC